jgi:branched-chain amino acid transport system permease protein
MIDNILLLLDNPVSIADLVIQGLMVGAVFALIAYGMALVWGVMNIINIAQGEFVILGGFVAFYFSKWGITPFLAVPAAAVALYLIGWLLYRVVIYRIVDRDLFTSILATFGISIFLQQVMNEALTTEPEVARSGLGTWTLANGGITIEQVRLAAFLFAALIGVILAIYLRSSRAGQAIRATAQNARAARIMGIDTDAVYARTFALNAAICGAAGALVAMIWAVQAYGGLIYTVRAFVVVIIAGLGNLTGVIGAGIALGALENLAGFIFGLGYQQAFVFGLIPAVLIYRRVRLSFARKVLR